MRRSVAHVRCDLVNAFDVLTAPSKAELVTRSGRKILCVSTPDESIKAAYPGVVLPTVHDLDHPNSGEDELEREEITAFGWPSGLSKKPMIDLDGGDDDEYTGSRGW